MTRAHDRALDVPVAAADPIVVDWAAIDLPDAWPDRAARRNPLAWSRLGRRVVGARRKVELPADMPGRERIPRYVLQEFHHLPNGFYSKAIVHGYVRGFDRLMFGEMQQARRRLAARLRGARAALDLGCGGGGLAGACDAAGIAETWGLDPSPYLLQIAARRHPRVRFVQGLAEDTGFPDARFDGVGACFLFHELPPRVADAALAEIHRILTPGGVLALAEPSPEQFRGRHPVPFLKRHGLRGLYFALVARWMHEPFVQGWHRRDVTASLAQHGFEVTEEEVGMPIRFVTARRR
jgi:ubiquinone/menaquinone biosynthesis C-methylase UbiE